MALAWLRTAPPAVGRWSAPLATLGNVALALVLAWSLAELAWLVLADRSPHDSAGSAGVGPTAITSRRAPSDPAPSTLGPAGFRLFGAPASHPGPRTASAAAGDPILTGLVRFERPGGARAIIGTPGEPAGGEPGDERAYPVGAVLPDASVLVDIGADHVVVRRDGVERALYLDVTGDPERSDRPVQHLDNTADPELARNLGRYQRELRTNPRGLLGLMSMAPIRRSGTIHGYRIEAGRDRELLERIGLAPGDVLTGVNGIELDSPAGGLDVLRELAVADHLSIDVERGGRRLQLSLRVGGE